VVPTAKVLEYAVDVDNAGRMTIPGGGQFVPPEGWSADHLLLAALVRCSIDSLTYHAPNQGLIGHTWTDAGTGDSGDIYSSTS